MSLSQRAERTSHNLTLLQELVAKEPEAYAEEFHMQLEHFGSSVRLLELQPEQSLAARARLHESVAFVARVCHRFPVEAAAFGAQLADLLHGRGPALDADTRLALCRALVGLRNRRVAPALPTAQLLFELAKCRDKPLRRLVFGALTSQLKRLARGKQKCGGGGGGGERVQTQQLLVGKLQDSRAVVARTALLVLIDAYRRGFWRHPTVANAIAQCCFHKVQRIQVAALKFLLGVKKGDEADGPSDASTDDEGGDGADTRTLAEVMSAFHAAKKTRKRLKTKDKAKKLIGQDKKKSKNSGWRECNAAAVEQLYDAQEFAERLLAQLQARQRSERFELRVLQMSLLARVIGTHQLLVLGFYTFLQRYLQPKQRDVTHLLLYAAQATHSRVPPDAVAELVGVVAANFVSDRCSAEAMAVGLNAIREMLAKCPCAADADLLHDLVGYRTYKNKNVSMAARALVGLFRSTNPQQLHRKHRGRPTEATKELIMPEYGRTVAPDFVPGAECLPEESPEQDSQGAVDSDGDDDLSSDDDAQMEDGDSEDGAEEATGGEEMSGEAETAEERRERAAAASQTRILSQEEHRQISANQLRKRLAPFRKRRRAPSADNDQQADGQQEEEGGMARLRDIERLHKRPRRLNKEERLAMVQEGREGRERFGQHKSKRTKAHVGRTNRELAKCKPLGMVQPKKRGQKRQRSFRQRQISLKKYLLKQKGAK